MAKTQLSYRLGADNSIFDIKEKANVKYSVFDYGRKHFTSIDLGGLYPVDWFSVYPGDRVSLGVDYLIDTFPLEVAPMNNYFVRTHWWFVKKSALWKGWNTFITRGRSGDIDLTIPFALSTDLTAPAVVDGESRQYSSPCSLSSYLGLKPVYYDDNPENSKWLPYITHSVATGHHLPNAFSKLPFIDYQKICRNAYMPSNLLQDNHIWFPNDLQDEWRLNYAGSNTNGLYFMPESAAKINSTGNLILPSEIIANHVPSVEDNVVDLRQLRYAPYSPDYFTQAKPWLVRGKEQALSSNADMSGAFQAFMSLLYDNSISEYSRNSGFAESPLSVSNSSYVFVAAPVSGLDANQSMGVANEPAISRFKDSMTERISSVFSRFLPQDFRDVDINMSFTANTLRNLLAMSVWQERNTLTDGNYNRTVQVHWNRSPHSPEYEPLYIGGTTDLIQFGQVVQTSASSSGSPLGSKASNGAASGRSKVFDFTADDYGIIMGIMFIVPEVVYSQGVDREWTDLTWDSQYQPEFASLGYQPILNQELYVQGDDAVDKSLFGYQTRYAYLKQRRNEVSGLFTLTPEQDNVFGPYLQARRFSELPSLSSQFVTMSPDNIDRSFLSFENLPAFRLQFASEVRLVRALPYQSTPNTFGF